MPQGQDQATTTGRLRKSASGIRGLDEILEGGLPAGRPTLVCGGPGCGKSLFGVEFLVRGVIDYGEPGVLMTFEEPAADVTINVASLGFDLPRMVAARQLAIDYVRVERSEIEETGEYNLEGLFVRLQLAMDRVKARRVVLDTLESLFSGLSNPAVLRAELRRLFMWLKERGVTTIVTGERGTGSLTRQGLEEYVSDCVILLDHRVDEQISTRRLRVVKYRGSTHGTNEFPFLLDRDGITVIPITSAGMDHPASEERVSSGIPAVDRMLDDGGFFKGSTVLLTGTSGTGKTSMAARFLEAAAEQGKRALYFAFEESQDQLIRNMRSIGIDLGRHAGKNLLFACGRPTVFGLEAHLAGMLKKVDSFHPDVVAVDPISSLLSSTTPPALQAMLIRLVDHLKMRQITTLFTSLSDATLGEGGLESTPFGISSIVDAWIVLRDIESGRSRSRGINVLKARGMNHVHDIQTLVLSGAGIDVLDADPREQRRKGKER